MRRQYTVACLSGDGLGPELMAEATRTLRKVARMHGFSIQDVHVPFGREALTRSGHPLPASTRGAVLEADAVLVANVSEPALAGVTAQLDLRARLTQVLCSRSDFLLLSPLGDGDETWTADRAFRIAGRRRGRLVFIENDTRWRVYADEASKRSLVSVDHAGLAETMRALAFEPRPLDLVVSASMVAPALEELAAGTEGDDRLVAVAQLAANGPSVFSPGWMASPDDAGQGVADPSSMLLAVSMLLRDGLGEDHAAETLWTALRHARVNGSRPATMRRSLAATTRDFGDAVVSLLPTSHRNAEFVPESAA